MYGKVNETPQTENTLFHPRSPYACGKVFAYYLTQNYRESYGMHCCSGILFNHEGPRRGGTFVTKKITDYVRTLHKDPITNKPVGKYKPLQLGNLDARRDWGYAGDYVKAMWLMLQNKPKDYVIATGETHSVKEFCEEAFGYYGLDYKQFVQINKKYFRPAEVDLLQGDSRKAQRELGWKPDVNFKELVKLMIEA
jgi:GDPmannose 4,6-dehydratase